MSLPSVVVIGGGVIGRTSALALARQGHRVTLVSKDDPADTTSILAGAVWMPVYAEPMDKLVAWGRATFDRLVPLATDPQATGVQLLRGTVWYAVDEPDLRWIEGAGDVEIVAGRAGGPAGAKRAATATLPCIDMSRHLPWLQKQGAAAGVVEERRAVSSVDEAAALADLVVLATGLETGALVPGSGMYPIQGQTVRVANPGGIGWASYEDAEVTTYVIPRIDEIIIGGTHVVGATSLEPDPALEATLLERAIALKPQLAGSPVTSRAVGLRPGRDAVRLERIGDVIHNYGHGGSGVTVAYGCADEVAALARG